MANLFGQKSQCTGSSALSFCNVLVLSRAVTTQSLEDLLIRLAVNQGALAEGRWRTSVRLGRLTDDMPTISLPGWWIISVLTFIFANFTSQVACGLTVAHT